MFTDKLTKSKKFWFAVALIGLLQQCALHCSKPEAEEAPVPVATQPKTRKKLASAAPSVAPTVTVAPSPSPKLTPTPKPELQAFNDGICKHKSYLRGSKAVSFSCLGANLGYYPAHLIAYATKEGEASAVNKLIKEGKFERADDQFDTKTDRRNVCIFYPDDSAACLELAQLAPIAQASSEEEAFKKWDASTCSSASPDSPIAQRTACQFVQAGVLQPEYIIYVGQKTDDAVEILRTSSYEVYSDWKEFNPLTERDISACVPYKDESVACYKGVQAEPDPEPELQPQPTTYPSGMTCADFATYAEAQAALPTNPQLDGNGDGSACESQFGSGGDGGSYEHKKSRHRRR